MKRNKEHSQTIDNNNEEEYDEEEELASADTNIENVIHDEFVPGDNNSKWHPCAEIERVVKHVRSHSVTEDRLDKNTSISKIDVPNNAMLAGVGRPNESIE